MPSSTWLRLLGLSVIVMPLGFVVPAWTDTTKGKSHALLIGVKDYGERATLGPLLYTENDVEELAKILDKPGSPFHKNVRLLTCTRGKKDKDAAPVLANINNAVKLLVEDKKKGDTVLVALAGHGIQLELQDPEDKEKPRSYAYFCPQDADIPGGDFKTGRHKRLLLLSDLLGDLGDCGAGVKLLLMDACRNVRSARSFRLNKELIPDGVAALFSCKTGQFSFETAKLGKGHGIFFHHVIEALKGEARDKRGRVTWGRLVEHVTEKVDEDVPRLVGGGASQTPHEIKNFAGNSPVLVSSRKGDDTTKDRDKAGKEKVAEGKKEITNSVGMKLVRIPAGKFTMGSTPQERDTVLAEIKEKVAPDWLKAESPHHEVEMTRPFFLGIHEVTQKQYTTVMGTNPAHFNKDGKGKDKVKDLDTDDFPVDSVSWEDAVAFCKRLSEREAEKTAGRSYRLPTEAEWEYAARGGVSSGPFCFEKASNSISHDQANFDSAHPFGSGARGSSLGRPCPVGTYKPNPFGLYDMHGNVWEWCADWYDKDYYAKSDRKDPGGPQAEQKSRLLRGGSWGDAGYNCRAACRYDNSPGYRNVYFGFRVVCVIAGQD